MASAQQRREAALAAINSRLNPPPAYDSPPIHNATSSATSSPQTDLPAPLFSGSPRPTFTEKEDREIKIKFTKLLDRGIVRDNGYTQSADAVETLIKIASNILTSDDPKFRAIKATNGMLQKKVLAVKGGHDYLIALGFRTQTVDFTKQYVFQKTLRSVHDMQIGTDVLQALLESLQKRVELSSQSSLAHRADEARRRTSALAEIEADRLTVLERAQREKFAREARAQAEREQREQEEREESQREDAGSQQEAESVVDRHDEIRREMAEQVSRVGDVGDHSPMRAVGEDEEEEGLDEEVLPTYGDVHWGAGRRLH